MSDKKPNPYEDFFKKRDEANNPVSPSSELQDADRGAPELKAEETGTLADKKNMIIAGVAILLTLAVVIVFVLMLASRLSGSDEPAADSAPDPTLARAETRDVANLQARIAAEAARKAAVEQAAREREERLAAEEAERQRLLNEKAEPEPEPENRLGRLGGSGRTAESAPSIAEARGKKADALTAEERALLRKASGDVLGYEAEARPAGQRGSQPDRPTTLGNMLATERHQNGVAYVRQSRKYLLMRGTNIACTLLPRVVTNYASQPTCMVNEDVYSPEGIVLIDRGSKVLGEQRIAMKAGVGKVFIGWGDIETDNGVSINIDSMAADQLGGSGVDAWIDNHYMQRFGGAILLSFVDDLFEIAANKAADTEYNFEASTDNASSMAQIALENSINIEPTGYIMPGKQINIIVARDVDFSHIYKVK